MTLNLRHIIRLTTPNRIQFAQFSGGFQLVYFAIFLRKQRKHPIFFPQNAPQDGTKEISVIACHTSIAVFFSAAASGMARILHKTA
jgi:hypothetical protein